MGWGRKNSRSGHDPGLWEFSALSPIPLPAPPVSLARLSRHGRVAYAPPLGPCAPHPRAAVGEFWSPDRVLTTLLCPQILRDTFTESCTRISQDERHKMKGFLGMGPQSWGKRVGWLDLP